MPDVAVGTFVSTEEIAAGRARHRHGSDDAEARSGHDAVHDHDRRACRRVRPRARRSTGWRRRTSTTCSRSTPRTRPVRSTVSVGTVESAAIKANDILRNMTTGEALLVTAVGANGDLTVVPSVGNSAASAAGTSGDKLRLHRLGV